MYNVNTFVYFWAPSHGYPFMIWYFFVYSFLSSKTSNNIICVEHFQFSKDNSKNDCCAVVWLHNQCQQNVLIFMKTKDVAKEVGKWEPSTEVEPCVNIDDDRVAFECLNLPFHFSLRRFFNCVAFKKIHFECCTIANEFETLWGNFHSEAFNWCNYSLFPWKTWKRKMRWFCKRKTFKFSRK